MTDERFNKIYKRVLLSSLAFAILGLGLAVLALGIEILRGY